METQYRREMDEYEEKITKGQERVKELNARFADWYYVIPDKVYQKIHLGRDKIVREKAPPKEAGDHGPGDGHGHGKPPSDKSSLETFNRLRQLGPGGE